MKKHLVLGYDEVVGPWTVQRCGGDWHKGRGTTVGLASAEYGLMAGVLFEDYNGANILMHGASDGPGSLSWEFITYCCEYAFVQLECKRITSIVASTNTRALSFVKSLGFVFETALKDAAPDGDLHVHAMFRDQCRWLALRDRCHGKIVRTCHS